MAEIAVIHRHLGIGGGESVCFHILEALEDDYDVHLFALNQPNFDELNQAFGTNVNNVKVHTPDAVTTSLSILESGLQKIVGDSVGSVTGLELGILSRRYQHEWEKFDLRISTHGELPLSVPAIQYLHHPFLNRWTSGGHFEIDSTVGKAFNWLCTRLSGARPDVVRQSQLLTNSTWSAEQIERIYSTQPKVLYPPIKVPDQGTVPWVERENGFVSIGRVSPDKRTHIAIEIVDKLRAQGEDVHLHHVGPINVNESYTQRIREIANNRKWITLEGPVSRDQLYDLIRSHRWGIHTKPFEHFGMAVAELVAGGAVPLVPNSGGQTEIVNNNEDLLYNSSSDATQKAEKLINNPSNALDIRTTLPDIERMCGEDKFIQYIQNEVEGILYNVSN